MSPLNLAADASCVDGGISASNAVISAPMLIIVTGAIGILFSIYLLFTVASVKLDVTSVAGSGTTGESASQNMKLRELYDAITCVAGPFRPIMEPAPCPRAIAVTSCPQLASSLTWLTVSALPHGHF